MNQLTYSALSGANLAILEDLHKTYETNPSALDQAWLDFFTTIDNNSNLPPRIDRLQNTMTLKTMGIENLLNTYRAHGHLAASLDPLNIHEPTREIIEEKLALIGEKELLLEFSILDSRFKAKQLKDIIPWFEKIYCGNIGYEHHYIVNEKERLWLQTQIESFEHNQDLSKNIKLELYDNLVHADFFEHFLAKKYIGKKRFSLEGGESFIPLLSSIIEKGADDGLECIVMGMAHRGRLNVLVNSLQKPASQIFAEFEENYDPQTLDYADVKYHLGYSNHVITRSGKKIKLSLAFNPSHLEAVNPVVMGSVRARQTMAKDHQRDKFMALLIHGDAAFAGQGIVAESLNLVNLESFSTGGVLHVVFNNQIGFTTLPMESRSTLYATDLAKGFQIPIFHVNGDDPESVFRVVQLAMSYRKKFKKDVILDLVCYRKLGHNETDEPAFTQPSMYKKIRKHKPVVDLYEEKIIQNLEIKKEEIEKIKINATKTLDDSFKQVKEGRTHMVAETLKDRWSSYSREETGEPDTNLLKKQLKKVANALFSIPDSFNIHPKLIKLIENRKKMYEGEIEIDWGFAEALAMGSILDSQHKIRFVGQDSIRGTFSHRHAGFVDRETEEKWFPLNHISENQSKLEIVNSPLSEFSVLGFEYGYSLADPDALVVWEAQFGDFANGAQVIIDQFLSSSEVKWLRMSGLTMLLPHGYEGQGPEHSSARLERFLHMCAEQNLQVCYPTTPAQIFHLLRRQILRKSKKPLIIMSPKSLLRLPEASSSMKEITHGRFEKIIINSSKTPEQVTRLILMSGKIYYEIYKMLKDKKITNIILVRVEQLYPFPENRIKELLKLYSNLKECYWLQEEPANMGAWLFLETQLKELLQKNINIKCISRPTSASPAAGLAKIHSREQQDIIQRALE